MQSLALNIEVLDAAGNVVALKDEDDDFQIDRAAEEMGINLSRDESLAMDDTFRSSDNY
jgi:DNA-directed RNA polymerase subunit beta